MIGEGQEKKCDDEEMKRKGREERERKKAWPDGWSVKKKSGDTFCWLRLGDSTG